MCKGQKRCWEYNGCYGNKRDDCPAYKNPGIECWDITATICGALRDITSHMGIKQSTCHENCKYRQYRKLMEVYT